jgi:ketosteroid isomerase-like protein
MSCLENATNLYTLMGSGQMMEAFEKYYAGNVEVVEMATGEVRNGKDAQRKALHQWANMVKERHDGGVGAITSNEETNTTCVESWIDITTQDGNRMKMEEVAVQKWEGDQIVQEKFYYQRPGGGQ